MIYINSFEFYTFVYQNGSPVKMFDDPGDAEQYAEMLAVIRDDRIAPPEQPEREPRPQKRHVSFREILDAERY